MRPHSVRDFEEKIWKELFRIARGEIDVFAAAEKIISDMPDFMKISQDDAEWFDLGMFTELHDH